MLYLILRSATNQGPLTVAYFPDAASYEPLLQCAQDKAVKEKRAYHADVMDTEFQKCEVYFIYPDGVREHQGYRPIPQISVI